MRVGILVLSDKGSRGERKDLSGELLREMCEEAGFSVEVFKILPDEKDEIVQTLKNWCDELKLDLILTSGGTGLHPRDVTPDATKEVIEKEVPGIAEYIRFVSFSSTPMAALSRAIAGIRKETLIVNLPGSPKAIKEIMPSLVKVLKHGVEKLKGDDSECGGG